MLSMSIKQEVILRYYRDKESQRKISRSLSISRKTVKKYITEYEESKAKNKKQSTSNLPEELDNSILEAPRYDSSTRVRRKLTAELSDLIDSFLEKNKEKCKTGKKKQVLRKIDIWEELKRQGYDIGYTTVCNYIRAKAHQEEAYIRQNYEAGKVCEFDWGEVKLEINGVRRVYQLAVFTLAWSNYRYAYLFNRQDSQSFQQSHVLFFEHIQGVPHQLVYDNMRVAVRRFVGKTEKEPTNCLLGMSMYYQYNFRFCNVRRGNEKGHVERSVEYVRRKAFGLKDEFVDEKSANAHLQNILKNLNGRLQKEKGFSGTSMLAEEQKTFAACPVVAMECSVLKYFRVDKYATICESTNHYSVPEEFTGKQVEVRIYAERLDIYYQSKPVWSHQRRRSKYQWYLYLGHYIDTLRRKPGALKGAEALEQADDMLKGLFRKYFSATPREFIELMQYRREKSLTWLQIENTVNDLLKLGCREISLAKIKVRIENTPILNKGECLVESEIEKHAQLQLQSISKLFNNLN